MVTAAPATFPALAPPVLPRPLRDYRNRHAGATIIVCGCGRSLAELPEPERWTTIGVNDVGRLFDPTYLVVVNPRSQFRGDRFRYVAESRAGALFTQLDPQRDLGISHPAVVRFRLGRRGGTEVDGPDALPYTRNSPYVAVCLAAFLGARRIGLIGVDFTDHHFFAATGTHPLSRELAQIDREYGNLAAALARRGVELVNLSRESRLSALPKAAPGELLGRLAAASPPGPMGHTGRGPDRTEPAGKGLRVVHVALTNCAGAIWNLHRLLRRHGDVDSRVITASDVTNGRRYPRDLLLGERNAVREVLARADVVHFHNFIDHQSPAMVPFRRELAGRTLVLQFHSEPAVLRPLFPGRDPVQRTDLVTAVVAQKQARFFPIAVPVPNVVDVRAPEFQPREAPAPARPRVIYTPTDTAAYPQQSATCRGKGFPETKALLQRLEQRGVIEAVMGTNRPWEEVMAERRRCHVLIDECVTGGYHLTSLEGLALGLVTVAHLDRETRALLARLTGSTEAELPWLDVRVETLAESLTALARDPERLLTLGAAGRRWMERYWTPDFLLGRYLDLYERAAAARRGKAVHTAKIPRPAAPPRANPPPAIRPLDYQLPGKAHPRRSEELPQRVRIGSDLLARRDSLAGKACHVLGNGPSLTELDLGLLAARPVFAVNSATHLDALGRPADYYCVSDRRFLERDEGRSMAAAAAASMRVFAGYCDGFLPAPEIHYLRIIGGDGVSSDAVSGVYHGCSVVLFAAQLALWLGARQLLLHGCELDYGRGRFREEDPPRPHDDGNFPRVRNNFAALARKLAEMGGTLTIVGPSRLTGHFGDVAVSGIDSLTVEEMTARLRQQG
jgi:hypothetical protein